MKRYLVLGAAAASGVAPAVMGSAIPSIQLGNGQVLNVQSVVYEDPTNPGIDTNTAFLAIDFSNNTPAGPTYAWEYHFNGNQTETGMINDVANADPALTPIVDAYDLSQGWGTFYDNFNYGNNTGSATWANDTTWEAYYGPYDSGSQSVLWSTAPWGSDTMQLGIGYDSYGDVLTSYQDDYFYGWTINTIDLDTYGPVDGSPMPALDEVPEPGTLTLISVGSLLLLKRHSRRRGNRAAQSC